MGNDKFIIPWRTIKISIIIFPLLFPITALFIRCHSKMQVYRKIANIVRNENDNLIITWGNKFNIEKVFHAKKLDGGSYPKTSAFNSSGSLFAVVVGNSALKLLSIPDLREIANVNFVGNIQEIIFNEYDNQLIALTRNYEKGRQFEIWGLNPLHPPEIHSFEFPEIVCHHSLEKTERCVILYTLECESWIARYDIRNSSILQQVKIGTSRPAAMEVVRNGKLVLLAYDAGWKGHLPVRYEAWDIISGTLECSSEIGKGCVDGLYENKFGFSLANSDGYVRLADIRGKEFGIIPSFHHITCAVAYTEKGHLIATLRDISHAISYGVLRPESGETSIEIWSFPFPHHLGTIQLPQNDPYSLIFSPSGDILVAVDREDIIMWKITSKKH